MPKGNSLGKFAQADPFAKDQSRHLAGESALDAEARIAQQGACQARIDAKAQPIIKGSRVTAQENHYRQVTGTGRSVRFHYVPYRVFEGVGEVKSIEDGLARVVVDGRLIVTRVEQLVPVPCRALVVYEPPQRPAVNVLPKGETPIALYATTETTRYDRAGHSVMGQAKPPHYGEIVRNRALVSNTAECQPVERVSGNGAYFWQFNGTAGYRYAHHGYR